MDKSEITDTLDRLANTDPMSAMKDFDPTDPNVDMGPLISKMKQRISDIESIVKPMHREIDNLKLQLEMFVLLDKMTERRKNG